MEYNGKDVVSPRSESNSDEGNQIYGGDHPAFLFRSRAVLNQGAQRHHKKSSKETKESEINNAKANPRGGERKQFSYDGQRRVATDGAEGSANDLGGRSKVKQCAENCHTHGA